ncbi:MAG: hypothetical protein QXX81_05265 [Zestosphaera sp.]
MTISRSFEAILPLSPDTLMTVMGDLRFQLSLWSFNEVYVKSINKIQNNEGEIDLAIGDTVNRLNVKLVSKRVDEAQVVELEGRGDVYLLLRLNMSARGPLTLVKGELTVKASYFKERRIEGALDKFVKDLRMKIMHELPIVVGPLRDKAEAAPPTPVPPTEGKTPSHFVKLSEALGVDPEDVPKYMTVKVGDRVRRGDVIARYLGMSGLVKREVVAPVDGVVESINDKTGTVVIKEQVTAGLLKPAEVPVAPAPKPTPPERVKVKELEVHGDPRGLEDDVRLSLILLKSQLVASAKREVGGKDVVPTLKELCKDFKDVVIFGAWTDNEGNRIKVLLHGDEVMGFRVERPDGGIMNGADALKFAAGLTPRVWRIYIYSVPPELVGLR